MAKLAEVLAQRCCDSHPDGANEREGGSDNAATAGGAGAGGNVNVSSTRSKADTIERAVRYIACLQSHLANARTQLDRQ